MVGFLGYVGSGAKWPGTTITYSYTTTTSATSPGGAFSSTIPTHSRQGTGDPEYGAYSAIDSALAAWAQASGLTLQRVIDSTMTGSLPDIRIGYGTLSSGLSAFSATVANGLFQPGAEIMLEDRSANTIRSDAAGSTTYATGQFVGAVAESVIGHALGLASATGPSIRFGGAGDAVPAGAGDTSPALINAASIIGLETLYGPILPTGDVSMLGKVDTDPNGFYAAARYGVAGGTALTAGPADTLASLSVDGMMQLQASEPGAPVVTIPGVRVLGTVTLNGTSIPYGLTDPTGSAESIARLYQGILGRSPDLRGLYNYSNQVDSGALDLVGVANILASSLEFMSRDPSATGTDAASAMAFVNRLYQNLFSRPADPGTGYVRSLLAGSSKGSVANSIAQSLEARGDYLPYEGDHSEGTLYRLYQATLSRAPDPSGEAAYVPKLDAGLSAQDFASILLDSQEFLRTAGAESNSAFVNQAFNGALKRAPDPSGYGNYMAELSRGVSKALVAAEIGNSSEARATSALATHDGWVTLAKVTG